MCDKPPSPWTLMRPMSHICYFTASPALHSVRNQLYLNLLKREMMLEVENKVLNSRNISNTFRCFIWRDSGLCFLCCHHSTLEKYKNIFKKEKEKKQVKQREQINWNNKNLKSTVGCYLVQANTRRGKTWPLLLGIQVIYLHIEAYHTLTLGLSGML